MFPGFDGFLATAASTGGGACVSRSILPGRCGRLRARRALSGTTRRGFQVSIADLVVAAVASHHRRELFTLDQDFARIRKVLPLDLYEPMRL